MSARVCTECGAHIHEDAEACESCAAEQPPGNSRGDHSDLRIELERIDAALPLPSTHTPGRWSRVSEQPPVKMRRSDAPKPPPLAAANTECDARVRASDTTTPPETPPGHNAAADAAVSPNAEPREALPPPAAPQQNVTEPPAALQNTSATAQDLKPAISARPHAVKSLPPASPTPATISSKRPPVLASEALLRELAPAQPEPYALRVWCPLLGGLGATAAWHLAHGTALGMFTVSAFTVLVLLGLLPMRYQSRAAGVALISASALGVLLWSDGACPNACALRTLSVSVLSLGLLFRSWHRASVLSRLIVGAGVVLAGSFLRVTGDLVHVTLADTAWQSWLPPVSQLGFALLVLLSLLAFMDARSTGGSFVWAIGFLCWNAVYAAFGLVVDVWPKWADHYDLNRLSMSRSLVQSTTPLLTALVSIAIAQWLAAGCAQLALSTAHGRHRRWPPWRLDHNFPTPEPRSHH